MAEASRAGSDQDRSATSDSFDKPPGGVLVFPDAALESAPVAAVEDNDFHPHIFDADDRGLEAATRVAWAPDRKSPCYSHMLVDGGDKVQADSEFDFGKAALELYLAANRYAPKGNGDIIVFGLRGARLKGADKSELVDHLALEDVRPDHVKFRCVIGYFFRDTGKFSAYTASTVPWHKYMSDGAMNYNLLPTGCYVYKKGVHRPAHEERWVDPAFRLSDASGSDSGPATVLRTPSDTVFDLNDPWDKCAPSDNIHCAYSDEKFSSLGCQTVKGGMHDGLWARFQATIAELPKNARVDYVLLTGAEASIAAAFARDGKTAGDANVQRHLGRLRVGSESDEVQRLQSALGLPVSSYFGAATKKRLTEMQRQRGLPADGIFAPAIENQFGGGIFAQPSAPMAATVVPYPKPVPAVTAVPSREPMVAPVVPTPPSASPGSHPAPNPAGIGAAMASLFRPAPPAAAAAPPPSRSATALLARDTLRRIAPRPSSAAKAKIWDAYMDALSSEAGAKVFADYGLDQNPQRLVFILANMCAETGGLTLIWESMNYSADRLVDIFGNAANIDDDEARRLAGNPQAIGERVYGLGNERKARQLGNTQAGDGYRYRGGGFLQTTGRDNYKRIGAKIGEDLESHPELIENPLISLKAACAEWQGTKLNDYADQGSFRACCNGINYGDPRRDRKPIGFNDRLEYLGRGLTAFHLPPVKRSPGALESMDDSETMECGDLGPAVAGLQRRLRALGYPAGPPNGHFTTATRDALLSFQANNGLATTGASDRQTRIALETHDAIPYGEQSRDEPELAPLPSRPPASVPATRAPVSAPAATAPRSGSTPAGDKSASALLVLTVCGLIATVGILAAVVGWLPMSVAARDFAGDAAAPLMLMGWILALLAVLRGRGHAA